MIKTWRIHFIFSSADTHLTAVHMPTRALVLRVVLWLALEVGVICGVWMAVDPPQSVLLPTDTSTRIPACKSRSDAYLYVFVGSKVLPCH
jgi:hypothetical protein